ncbi:hypothetical protein E2320_007759, partial [Naja naja]
SLASVFNGTASESSSVRRQNKKILARKCTFIVSRF